MIDLQRFCASDLDVREHLRQPWWHDGWVYATNGHLCVRVHAGRAQTDAQDKPANAPDAAALFRKHLEDRTCEFLVMPTIQKLTECFDCDGKGKVRAIKCADCTDGEFVHGNFKYQCQNCEDSPAGAGWEFLTEDDSMQPHEVLRTCETCDGLGFEIRANGGTTLGEARYATVYLAMLSSLPQIRVMPGDPSGPGWDNKLTPAVFLFDGGQALLMPRRD